MIFSQSYSGYNARGKKQILWREKTFSQAIFPILPPSSSVLHLLQHLHLTEEKVK